jgi:hypothetical protein
MAALRGHLQHILNRLDHNLRMVDLDEMRRARGDDIATACGA